MTFVDEITLDLSAGDGGDGVVRWLHLKGKEFSGPSGGDGGRGGDVVIRAVKDLSVLTRYTHSPNLEAEKGDSGRSKNQTGKNGSDLIVELPIGTVLTRELDGAQFELLEEGQEMVVLKGGKGGLGNTHFKSSTNINPMEQTNGKPGEHSRFFIELRLIADVGFVGLPNAGKSTLLNTLTNAKSEVGNYNFTTLEPHLGTFYEFIIADIPGLIEGASQGKGLGHKFLRHISRTKMLVHCVSLENENVVEVYDSVRNELKNFDEKLLDKHEIILLTKSDEVDQDTLNKKREELIAHTEKTVREISVLDDASVKKFADFLAKELEEKKNK
ncbi:MAG: GTPase ObgE [Candidatus Campbellbacteria bacterium]|nr:GTPase ObgE [Candidatus Campbellbacteria bacterium]